MFLENRKMFLWIVWTPWPIVFYQTLELEIRVLSMSKDPTRVYMKEDLSKSLLFLKDSTLLLSFYNCFARPKDNGPTNAENDDVQK